MKTIIEIIDSRLNDGNSNCSFTYLEKDDHAQTLLSLPELHRNALEVAQLLPKNNSVLLLLPHNILFIKAFFGCLYGQSIAVPAAVPTKNRGLDKLKSIISDAGISFGITTRETINNLHRWFGDDELFSRLQWLLIENIDGQATDFRSLTEFPKPEQIAFLQYTSGSTGNPKGVVITHENIIANSRIIQNCFQNNAESVSVCWLPSFHDMGLIDGIIQPVFSDFRSIMMSPIHFLQKPVRWFKAITEYRATYSGAPNFAYDLCNDRIGDEELTGIDLSSLRCLYNGSEPVRQNTMRKFVDRFSAVGFSEERLFTCYGLAEATLAVTTSKLGSRPATIKVDEKKLRRNRIVINEDGTNVELVGCGGGYLDTCVKVVDPNTLKECAEKEIGEIWVSGRSISPGYLNGSAADRKSFAVINGKRFLRTGDLGFLFEDELFITGRIKDLIIIRGTNHYPQDIEQTTSASHPALHINGCAAFSVEVDNEERLVVVQELKRAFRKYADYDSIFESIVAEISRRFGVVPFDVVLVAPNTVPKTTSGKIQRGESRDHWHTNKLKTLAVLRDHLFYEKMRHEIL